MKPYTTEWEGWPIEHLLPSHMRVLDVGGGNAAKQPGTDNNGASSAAESPTPTNEKRNSGIGSPSRRKYGKRGKSPNRNNDNRTSY